MSNIRIGTAIYETKPELGATYYFTVFGEADINREMEESFGDEYGGDARGNEFEVIAVRDGGLVLAKYSRSETSWGKKTGVVYSEFVELRFERDEDIVTGNNINSGNDLDAEEIVAEWLAE